MLFVLLALFAVPSVVNVSYFDGLQPDFSNLIMEVLEGNSTTYPPYQTVEIVQSQWLLANVSLPDNPYTLNFLAGSPQNSPAPPPENITLNVSYISGLEPDFSNLQLEIISGSGIYLAPYRIIEFILSQWAIVEIEKPSGSYSINILAGTLQQPPENQSNGTILPPPENNEANLTNQSIEPFPIPEQNQTGVSQPDATSQYEDGTVMGLDEFINQTTPAPNQTNLTMPPINWLDYLNSTNLTQLNLTEFIDLLGNQTIGNLSESNSTSNLTLQDYPPLVPSGDRFMLEEGASLPVQDGFPYIDLPADTPSKVQNGVRISTDDYASQIFTSAQYHYYHLQLPADTSSGAYPVLPQDFVPKGFGLNDYRIYPVAKKEAVRVVMVPETTVPDFSYADSTCDQPDEAEAPFCSVLPEYHGEKTVPAVYKEYTRFFLAGREKEFSVREPAAGCLSEECTASRREFILEIATAPFSSGSFGGTFAGRMVDPDVTACGSLSSANSEYNLTTNISNTGATCITVSANNITLNCNGYSIRGNNTNNTYGINFPGTGYNSTINNCNISGYLNAVNIVTTQGVRIIGGNYTSNFNVTGRGIAIGGNLTTIINVSASGNSEGIYTCCALTSDKTSVQGSVANSSFGRGIYFISQSNFVNNSNIYTNGTNVYAFQVAGSVLNNTLQNSNVSAFVPAFGIYIFSADNTTIRNVIVNATRYGISLQNGANDNVFDNVRSSTSTAGYTPFIVSVAGGSSGNRVRMENSTLIGVTIVGSLATSNNNTFINNTFISTSSATLFDLSANSSGSIFYWNNFTSTTGLYVNDANGSNFYNTTINGVPAGNIYGNVINGSVSVNGSAASAFSGLYYGSTGTGYPYSQSTSLGKFVCAPPNAGPTATSITNSSAVGSVAWSLPEKANTSDNSWANITMSASQVSNYLNATGFGFNIPAGATIRGIQIVIERQAATASRYNDHNVSLVRNGTLVGTGKVNGSTWPNADTTAIYGNSTDLWGTSWGPADINNAATGLAIAANRTTTGTSVNARIDYVNMTVFYTPANCADYGPLTPTSFLACGNLTTAGATYSMTINATITGSTCFNVQAANVTLDCNGYSIMGNNSTATYGVFSDQYNTSVIDCNISNFQHGIYFNGATDGLISKTNASTTHANGSGILLSAASRNTLSQTFGFSTVISGIALNASSNNNTLNSTIGNSTNGTGISLSSITGGTLYNVSGNSISSVGINLDVCKSINIDSSAGTSSASNGLLITSTQSNNITIRGLTGNSSSGDAIQFVSATNVTLTNSLGTSDSGAGIRIGTTGFIGTNITGNSNSSYGIYVPNGGNHTIINSTAISNGQQALRLQGTLDSNFTGMTLTSNSYYAFYSTSGSRNLLANSTVSSNTSNPAYLDTNSQGNTFINNTFASGNKANVLVTLVATAGGNLFYHNNFTNTSGAYVSDANGSNFYNTTIAGQSAGNIWFNVLNGSVSISGTVLSPFPSLYYGSAGSGYPYNNSTSLSKFRCNFAGCADYGPLTLSLTPTIRYADYADVLLVTNNNSTDSIAIGAYFALQRNITHVMNITTSNNSDALKFPLVNSTILQPIRTYLNGSNGTGINYIVLSKDIPLWTNETEATVTPGCLTAPCQNGSSVDSELMLVNTAYEGSISKTNSLANPYYGSTARFSRAAYGIYLVTRLDAYNVSTVYSMINKSANMNNSRLFAGLHILSNYSVTNTVSTANITLSQAGLNVNFNSSLTAEYPANQNNVSYFDTFGCVNFGGCLTSAYRGRPNYTWVNGSIVSIKYSWSAKTVRTNRPNESMVADFLEEGATAGIGYAVEPFANGVTDSATLANSYLNGFRIGEMAWSTIPSLSWGAVVFGDPKAGYPVADLNLSPTYPLTSNNLTCNITIIDDFHPALNLTYEWYKNGVNQTLLGGSALNVAPGAYTIANVASPNLTSADVWYCRAYVYYNGALMSSKNSSNVTVIDPNSLSFCTILNQANTIYNMSTNITTSGTCFTIAAENVTLNCRDYTINGGASGTAIAHASGNNPKVENCRINGFQFGISIVGSGGLVRNNSLNGSQWGIYFGSTNGTIANNSLNACGVSLLFQSGSNMVAHNITSTNEISEGFEMSGTNNVIRSSSFSGIGGSGSVMNGGGNTLANSSINNSGYALTLFSCTSCTVSNTNVTAYGSGPAIYMLEDSSGNTISGVRAHSDSSNALLLEATFTNVIANSTFSSNSSIAIYSTGGYDSTFINNTIASNSTLLQLESGNYGNLFYHNNFTNTSGSYVIDNDGGNYYNTTISGTPAGNIYANVMNNSVSILGTVASAFPSLYYGSAGTGYPYNNSTSLGKFSCNFAGCADYGPLTPTLTPAGLTCGALSTAGTIYSLTSNVNISGGTCFNVTAANVTLDCNGYTITGDNSSNTYGVFSNQYGTIVKYCTIQNFTDAIRYSGASNGQIFKNILSTSFSGASPIRLISSANNNLGYSSVLASAGGAASLLSVSSDSSNNTFYWNDFTNTGSLYVNDTNGSNYYNSTANRRAAGNKYYNVLNGSVSILGTVPSPFPGLYYGSLGSGYPYNSSTSQGKFACNFNGCGDYAPLTPTQTACVGATANYTCGQTVAMSCTLNGNLTNTWGADDTLSPVIQTTEVWENNIMDRVTVIMDANDSTKLHLWYMGGSQIGYAMSSTVDHYPMEAYYDSAVFDWGQATPNVTASVNATQPNGTSYLLQYRSFGSNNTSVLAQDWSTYTSGSINLSRYSQFRIKLRTLDPRNTTKISSVTFTNGTISWATNGSNWTSGAYYNGAISDATSLQEGKNQPPLKFTKYWANPVMGLAQFVNRSAMAPGAIIQDGGLFKHWFNAVWSGVANCSSWSLGYATSPDGINWTDGNNNTCMKINSTSSTGEVDPTVIKDADGYNIWLGRAGSGLVYSVSSNGLNNWSTPVNIYASASNAISTVKIGSTYHHYFESTQGGPWQVWYANTSSKNASIQNATLLIPLSSISGDWRQSGAATPWMVYNGSQVWGFVKGFSPFWSTPVGFIPDVHNSKIFPNTNPTFARPARVRISSNNTFNNTDIGISIQAPALIQKIIVQVETPYGNSSNGSITGGDKTIQVSVGTATASANAQNLTGTAADIINQTNFSANSGGIVGNLTSDYAAGYINSTLGGAYVAAPTIYYVNVIAKASNLSGTNKTWEVRSLITVTLEFDHYEPSACLTVGANNTTISCNGYGITGAINNTGTSGITSTYPQASILNCNINNFGYGVNLNGANLGNISNSTIWGASCGVSISSTSNSTVSKSTMSSSLASALCISGSPSLNNTISNNTLSSSSGTLVSITGASYNNLFYWNNFTNTSGLYVNDSNSGSTTSCNQWQPNADPGCTGAFLGGYWVLDSSWTNSPPGTNVSSEIIDNDTCTSDAGAPGSGYATADIYYRIPTNTTSASWKITDASCSDPTEFSLPTDCLDPSSPTYPYLHLQIQSSSDNADSYYYCESSGGLQGVAYSGQDVFEESVLWGINSPQSNQYNTTIAGHAEGNIYTNVINGSVQISGIIASQIPGLVAGQFGSGYPYRNSTSLSKFSCSALSCVDYGPLTGANYVSCGTLGTSGTVYNLTQNIGINGSTCFNVTAANVSLSCFGYTILGNGTPNSYGVFSSQFNTTVNNCTILSFADGIRFSGANNGSLLYNTVNNSTGNGIRLSLSNFTNLLSNRACYNTVDLNNSGSSNSLSRNACDLFAGVVENGHSGCTFACTAVWQRLFGNVSGNIILGQSNVSPYIFNWSSSLGLNVYFTDYDASINWQSLYAIGRNTSNNTTTNDFTNLDINFNLTSFSDNINSTYSAGGSAPKLTDNFTIYGRDVLFVPVANSSLAATGYKTGILWDAGDGGTKYNLTTRQSIVWVVKANASSTSDAYGSYGYLAQIPYTLKTYEGADNNLVAIYAELQ